MSDNFETKGTIARNSTDEILVKTGEYYKAKILLNILKRVLDE